MDEYFKEDNEEVLTDKTKVKGVVWRTLKQDAMQHNYETHEWFVSRFETDN